MPRRKKIISAEINLTQRKTAVPKTPRAKQDIPKLFNRRYDQITEGLFVSIVGLLSMFVVSIIFIAAFSLAALGSLKYISSGFSCCQNVPDQLLGSIIYGIDKKIYAIGEEMRVAISNNSNKAIYLAPCRYFNKFQKKTGDKWQNIFLSSCDSIRGQTADMFEKIPGKVEEEIPASKLGAGIWRGISDIYLDCREVKTESCGDMRIIYTEEFSVYDKQIDGASYNSEKPQL